MLILDTDVMIDVMRQYQPAIAWLRTLDEEEIILPGFVVMELIQGCKNEAEQRKVMRELEYHGTVWPSPETCKEALSVFVNYHRSHGIGILDVLIGQMAVALNLPLHPFNQKHYLVVPNLKTVQPFEKN
jgi:predicted nucleic acid-binding protein